MSNEEQELIEQMKGNGGSIALKTGYNFDTVTCLRLEILAKMDLVRLSSKTDRLIIYSLGSAESENYDEYSRPHFLALKFQLEGEETRGKIVNRAGDMVDIIYRNNKGELAITRISAINII